MSTENIPIGINKAQPATIQWGVNLFAASQGSPSIEIPQGQLISNTLAILTDRGQFAVINPSSQQIFPVDKMPALTNGQAYCVENQTSVPIAFTAFNATENVRVSNLDEAIIEPKGSVQFIFNANASEATPILFNRSDSTCNPALPSIAPVNHNNWYKVKSWLSHHKLGIILVGLLLVAILSYVFVKKGHLIQN